MSRTIYPISVGGDLQGTPWGSMTISTNQISVNIGARAWRAHQPGKPLRARIQTMPGYMSRDVPLLVTYTNDGDLNVTGTVQLDASYLDLRIASLIIIWNGISTEFSGGVQFRDEEAAYIRAGDINTAPTAPGAFTSPATGTVVRGGQTVWVNFTGANDAEGNISAYETHVQYNNDAFFSINEGPGGGWNYTVTSDRTKTTMRFAVRAKDSGGLIGPWTYSPVYTLDHNRPPNAPTLRSPLGTSNNPVTIQGNKRPPLSWNFVDPDSGNWQSSFIVKVVNGHNGDDVKYYQDVISGEQQHTPISDLPNNVLLAWAALTRDQNGSAGSWSPYQFFIINIPPSVTLSTLNNQNLTENARFTIAGTVTDVDNGNAVTIKYALNDGPARNITAQVSNGSTPIPFSKELRIKNGRLYDGTTELTGNLAEGVGHVLSVWAEDDRGGKSTVQTRTFYVTLNRPAILTINPFVAAGGLIGNDTVRFTGSVEDPDGNQVTVYYSANNADYVEVYSGSNGNFEVSIPVKFLIVGSNDIKVKAVDSYNAETIKTLKVNKEENIVTLNRGENRYKVRPPNGQAQGLILWIERDETLEVNAKISMVDDSEMESFQAMEWRKTENVQLGIVEDEYRFQADAAKTKISLIIEATGGSGSIKLISGVLAE